MYRKEAVRLITKVPKDFGTNNANELLEFYCKEMGLPNITVPWKCYCCNDSKHNFVAAFAVDAVVDNTVNPPKRNLYLVPICKDCLIDAMSKDDHCPTFYPFTQDLLRISKYNPSSEFVDISIEESQFSTFVIPNIPRIYFTYCEFTIIINSMSVKSNSLHLSIYVG